MFVVSILINIGMWFERFVIIVTSLHRDFLPSSWGLLPPDADRHLHLHGHARRSSSRCFLLFIRWLPMIAMAEVKGTMPEADPHYAPEGRARARRRAPRTP